MTYNKKNRVHLFQRDEELVLRQEVEDEKVLATYNGFDIDEERWFDVVNTAPNDLTMPKYNASGNPKFLQNVEHYFLYTNDGSVPVVLSEEDVTTETLITGRRRFSQGEYLLDGTTQDYKPPLPEFESTSDSQSKENIWYLKDAGENVYVIDPNGHRIWNSLTGSIISKVSSLYPVTDTCMAELLDAKDELLVENL